MYFVRYKNLGWKYVAGNSQEKLFIKSNLIWSLKETNNFLRKSFNNASYFMKSQENSHGFL